MKKLITTLGATALLTSGISPVVACQSKSTIPPTHHHRSVAESTLIGHYTMPIYKIKKADKKLTPLNVPLTPIKPAPFNIMNLSSYGADQKYLLNLNFIKECGLLPPMNWATFILNHSNNVIVKTFQFINPLFFKGTFTSYYGAKTPPTTPLATVLAHGIDLTVTALPRVNIVGKITFHIKGII